MVRNDNYKNDYYNLCALFTLYISNRNVNVLDEKVPLGGLIRNVS